MLKEAIGRVKTTAKLITQAELDATDLLRADHMKVEAMLLQLRIIQNGEHRMRILKQIRSDLTKHMQIEETLYYPVAERVEEVTDLVEHAYDEHNDIRGIIAKLVKMNPSSSNFSKTVTQLIMTIEEHVMNEEDKIFPTVNSELDELTLKRIDKAVQAAFGKARARRPSRATGRRAAVRRPARRRAA